MKKRAVKIEFWFILFAVLMFTAVSLMSLRSIQQQAGNARVVNYVGIVRGATQRLVKEELRRQSDDKLQKRLDTIVDELITGGPVNNLVRIPGEDFQNNMAEVRKSWNLLKEQIQIVRNGGDDQELYDQSQLYFDLANDTVFKAESYSETQVNRSRNILIGFTVFFIIILGVGLIYVIRMSAVRRIAYIDALTGLPNRTRCEQICLEHDRNKPVENLTVFMFDMNNLKVVNDKLGHQAGDRIIKGFGESLKTWAEEGKGFAGRYGGDEFLAVFDNTDNAQALEHLTRLDAIVAEYNQKQESKLERISFAAGFRVDNLQVTDMEMIILDSDRAMYERKRQMREGMLD
ncbi:diguanylate cyclase [Treponema primitia]|uniref:GGDEF domain-containing protein n=1 Tax=Treponema primitia TaxID=88058 RepID=UPI0039800203